jgi:phage shock protein A
MKLFKKIKNIFNKYKNVTQDIDDIKDRFETVAGSINDIYTNLGEAKWDIVALKSKVRDLEKGQK